MNRRNRFGLEAESTQFAFIHITRNLRSITFKRFLSCLQALKLECSMEKFFLLSYSSWWIFESETLVESQESKHLGFTFNLADSPLNQTFGEC